MLIPYFSPELEQCVVFEAFEASARNENVMAAEVALTWDFPGNVAAVSEATFQDKDFLACLSSFLEQASLETPKSFAAHTFKSGAHVYEYRNSFDPSLITSMLMAIIEENGRRLSPPLLRKRVKDDISWLRAQKPWRRLPLWLVMRVGIQRYLSVRLGGHSGRIEYKFFIAVVLSNYLHAITDRSPDIEHVAFLRTKLCRRMSKMDQEQSQLCEETKSRWNKLTTFFEGQLEISVTVANNMIQSEWQQYLDSSQRQVVPLNSTASAEEMKLRLANSYSRLQYLWNCEGHFRTYHDTSNQVSWAAAAKRNQDHLAMFLQGIVQREGSMQDHISDQSSLEYEDDLQDFVSTSYRILSDYLATAVPQYKGLSQEMSLLILKTMVLWKAMDEVACILYPILTKFHPVFPSDILDCLLLASVEDMEAARRVQVYIEYRIRQCENTRQTIFEEPGPGCFAHMFFEKSALSEDLSLLKFRIKDRAVVDREIKKEEWIRMTNEYHSLSRAVDTGTCLFISDESYPNEAPWHDEKHCDKCQAKSQMLRMKIQCHEAPLPDDDDLAKVACFELSCPKAFAAYRDAVWLIFTTLGLSFYDTPQEPRCYVRDYSELCDFANETAMSFSLASITKSCRFDETNFQIATDIL